MEVLILLVVLVTGILITCLLRHEFSQARAREEARAKALLDTLTGPTGVVELIEQNRRVIEARSDHHEKAFVRLALQVRRYPVVRMREKGTGRWISLAMAEVIDPETGKIMPGTPVDMPPPKPAGVVLDSEVLRGPKGEKGADG